MSPAPCATPAAAPSTPSPWATDPEPLTPDWSPGSGASSPQVDDGLVLDPDAPLSPLQAAERLSLRSLAYSGIRFPEPVLHDSARAVESHPDVVLMPPAFLIVERSGTEPWTPGSGLQATAHDARRTLAFALTWMEPRTRGLIPYDAEPEIDAHTVVAENTSPAAAELALYADAADRLRAWLGKSVSSLPAARPSTRRPRHTATRTKTPHAANGSS